MQKSLMLSRRSHAARPRGARRLGCLAFALAGVAGAGAVRAQCPDAPPPPALWSDREGSLRSQARLPDACLKSLVRQCDADAEAGFLDGGQAATCSLRYEALLQQGFRGDFQSFLRWWLGAARVASQ